MDLYPSNIMWKQRGENDVSIKIIDWASVQLVGQPHSSAIFERLCIKTIEATVSWDLLHLDVIFRNLATFAGDKSKGELDCLYLRHPLIHTPEFYRQEL